MKSSVTAEVDRITAEEQGWIPTPQGYIGFARL